MLGVSCYASNYGISRHGHEGRGLWATFFTSPHHRLGIIQIDPGPRAWRT